MNPFETPQTQPKTPEIHSVDTVDGTRIDYSPERGGIISSLKLNYREILYMDHTTFGDPNVNVKGGIPVLFPLAGPLPEELQGSYPEMKQHGFARELSWTFEEDPTHAFTQILRANEATKKIFPYDFTLSMYGDMNPDDSFTLTQSVKNEESVLEMPIAMGLHPYFKVPSHEKKNIGFDFPGGDLVKEKTEIWSNGKAISIDNPGVLRVKIPSLGILVLTISKEYRKIWVWSMTDKDFICIEPVMRDKGGLVTDPEMVQPGETFSASMNVRLE